MTDNDHGLPRFPIDPSLVLRLDNVGQQYHPTWWCLSEINIALRPRELVGLVGPNGSGKSTLIRILAGQLSPTVGKLTLAGRPLQQFNRVELAQKIGYLPQHLRYSFSFLVEEVVSHGRYPHLGPLGLMDCHDLEIVQQAMEWTNTVAFANRPLDELSGGERQLVMLASVLAQETCFLLLDEPTCALDLDHQVNVFELLAALVTKGFGIVVITHDLNLAAQYCHRLVLLREGRVLADGTPVQVMNESILNQVYQTDLIVDRNPVTQTPMVVLLGRSQVE